MRPGIVRRKQKDSEGRHISDMTNAHFALIREVNSTLGPRMKVSRKQCITTGCAWWAAGMLLRKAVLRRVVAMRLWIANTRDHVGPQLLFGDFGDFFHPRSKKHRPWRFAGAGWRGGMADFRGNRCRERIWAHAATKLQAPMHHEINASPQAILDAGRISFYLLCPSARIPAQPPWRNGRRHGLKIRCWATSVGVRVPPAAPVYGQGAKGLDCLSGLTSGRGFVLTARA